MTRTNIRIRPALAALALVGACAGEAPAAPSFPWRTYAARPDDWYRGDEAARLAENLLSHQSDRGDWPKNFDTSAAPYRGDRARLRGTFDNGATVGEMRFLARAHAATGRERYRDAFLKALDHVLAAQYPCGGWPQSDPPGKGYPRYITFNDNTTVNLLELVRDVARSDGFRFVDPTRREAADRAFARGIDCILRCQVRVDGRLTAWCAQHDPTTFEPRGARTFELPSLSGGESAGILLLLMSLDDPSPEVVRAVRAGADWYERSRLTGIRQVVVDGDKKIVRDPKAPPLWARFYEIDTNRPFFCGRDGVKKYDVAEIEAERRNGYAWYGNWGLRVQERFTRWEKDHGSNRAEGAGPRKE
jgi:PelA/Pel-15E family pectate lyase